MSEYISRGRKARRCYGFDEIALVPGDVTINPNEVDVSWKLGDKKFDIPEEVLAHMRECLKKGTAAENQWNTMYDGYEKKYPELAKEFKDASDGKLGVDIDSLVPKFEAGSSVATRKASGDMLNALMMFGVTSGS